MKDGVKVPISDLKMSGRDASNSADLGMPVMDLRPPHSLSFTVPHKYPSLAVLLHLNPQHLSTEHVTQLRGFWGKPAWMSG